MLKGRLAAYRAQTAPLAAHYGAKGMLQSVDGMAPIDAVTAAIDRILSPAAGKAKPARRKAKATGQRARPKPAGAVRGPRQSPQIRAARRPDRRAPKTRLDSANRVPGGG